VLGADLIKRPAAQEANREVISQQHQQQGPKKPLITGPGYTLNGSPSNADSVPTPDPRTAAALAAESRQQKNTANNGKLGTKLNQERANNRTELLKAGNSTQPPSEPLVYD